MLQRFLIFCFLITLTSVSSQRKKVDTVYVYEKVIVYDTIYLEKAVYFKFIDINLPKISTGNLIFKQISSEKSDFNPETPGNLNFGVEAGIGLKKNIWSESTSEKKQFGENIGLWISGSFFRSKLSFQLSANLHHWNQTFELDANQDDTLLNGYYFTEDNQPLLFQKFNDEHFELVLELKAIYEWKKFRPFAGILLNRNCYKMKFLVPENRMLVREENFTSNQINIGFSLGLQYRIFKRFLLELEYQKFKINNLSLKNNDFHFDIFKTNNTFAERKLGLGISYFISK
ncbi:hypothetical protein ASG31_09315 [Chryseobacterium sp. Leaf404]|uniref:hypothetical protein n=1 Tax=unclassified Chryseobacterium TaxID=2593645 RepID=UPI0006F1E078|nr:MULTISPECIES: hypothetical protein [unclassified Chryseobacterium]KQT17589.1 hypothetical protein ASG31_09315 [Chryseobacterium sp. Leaf404]